MKKNLNRILAFSGTLVAVIGGVANSAGAITYTSGTFDTGGLAFTNLGSILTVLVRSVIIVAGLASFIYLILGGFQYLTSGGDKLAAQAARDRITYAIMGLAIIVAAVAITYVLGTIFGVNILGNINWAGPTGTKVGGDL